jgi:hypothetical protein
MTDDSCHSCRTACTRTRPTRRWTPTPTPLACVTNATSVRVVQCGFIVAASLYSTTPLYYTTLLHHSTTPLYYTTLLHHSTTLHTCPVKSANVALLLSFILYLVTPSLFPIASSDALLYYYYYYYYYHYYRCSDVVM